MTIIDPHIKKDEEYFLYREAFDKKLFIFDKGGADPYFGHCWPGTSAWLDFINPKARDLLKQLYIAVPEGA